MITETKKFRALPFASWRTREMGRVVLLQSRGLRDREMNDVIPTLKLIAQEWSSGWQKMESKGLRLSSYDGQGQKKMNEAERSFSFSIFFVLLTMSKLLFLLLRQNI